MRNLTRAILLTGLLVTVVSAANAQNRVEVRDDGAGWRLLVDGEPYMVNGMNWDYYPVGTNYSYGLWDQSPEFIRRALDVEMRLLQNMGVNSIRVYTGIPKEWIEYIYDTYGITTMLNHSFGRYGLTLDGSWVANTEYDDPRVVELLLKEVSDLARDYKGTRGLLLYLLGNENNYGLFWSGAETEDIPMEDRQSTIRARHMYKLFNRGALAIKAIDPDRPVAMANGDLLFLDIIAQEVPDMDIFGSNVYRGMTFTDLYARVRAEYDKPVLLTEFGADAFNARTNQEDQLCQAVYNTSNWKEIYAQTAGLGRAQNSIGGYTFQFSDGWWKYGQTVELDVHNNNASWSNGGYLCDFAPGENNMNEEWFGIMAKGPTDQAGHYELYPRAAYYALKEVHQINVYEPGMTMDALELAFARINVMDALLRARGDKAALTAERTGKVRLSRLIANVSTFSTGGSLITTPAEADPMNPRYPNRLGFDHMQSFIIGAEANPAPNVRTTVDVNLLGNVAQNPIDEIFYENRGRPVILTGPQGDRTVESLNRVQIHAATAQWNHRWFDLTGFYRTGHYHWGYEGDFFGLYPEANYGPQIDIYNGSAPFGFEMRGKRQAQGLTLAFGPQLWWGANPAVLVKYSRTMGGTDWTAIYHEDLDRQGTAESSFAIPQPVTRRATLHASRSFGGLGIDIGGIWGGQPLNGREFQIYRNEGGVEQVYVDEIGPQDNWGGKLKVTYTRGLFNWYAQSAVMGLVANGGADPTLTFTGWRLKDSGSGNQYHVLSGVTYTFGHLQIAPNFLWQKPIEGPVPTTVPAPGRPRNILSDPFVVRGNRETVAGEILFTYDPTPGTYMYNWDNDMTEDAEFAVSAGFVYRHHPTTQDAAIGILPDGRSTFAFPGAPPAKDLWEVHGRVVMKPSRDFGVIAVLYGGDAQANGSDARTVSRFGTDVRMIYRQMKVTAFARVNDWGPYDYHRDFNLTFPVQLMADVSTTLRKPDWHDLPGTRIGVRGTWRTLDRYSPRYSPVLMQDPSGALVPNPNAIGFDNGREWEVRTYIQISI